MSTNIKSLSWDDVEHLTQLIAKHTTRPRRVAGISRGGLLPGIMLSHLWDVPFDPIVWNTRDHKRRRTDEVVVIVRELSHDPTATLVLVDDICDTGKTLREVYDFLINHQVPDVADRITVVSLVEKPNTEFAVDYSPLRVENDVWVEFPYEISQGGI